MNDDIYAEWLVKRKDKAWKIPAVIGAGFLLAFGFIFMMGRSWGFILPLIVVLGVFFGWKYLSVEFEYVFVTNELNIDRIFSQQLRKKGKKIQMENVDSVERTNTERNKNLLQNKATKLLDFSSQAKDAKTYSIYCHEGGQNLIVLFEPNEKILKAMWRCSPSKVHIE